MDKLKIGLKGIARDTVTENNTARAYGSGQVDVYATPAMIGLMECAALSAVDPLLSEGKTTVGIFVAVRHLAATSLGMAVEAKAYLKEIDGRRLVFQVEAFDGKAKIGDGEHQRFVVDAEKFLSRVETE